MLGPGPAGLVEDEALRDMHGIAREVARLSFAGKVQAVAEEKEETTQTMDFGNWKAIVSYGPTSRGGGGGGAPRGNSEPIGRALVAKIAENEFWVTGAYCKIDFRAASECCSKELRGEHAHRR